MAKLEDILKKLQSRFCKIDAFSTDIEQEQLKKFIDAFSSFGQLVKAIFQNLHTQKHCGFSHGSFEKTMPKNLWSYNGERKRAQQTSQEFSQLIYFKIYNTKLREQLPIAEIQQIIEPIRLLLKLPEIEWKLPDNEILRDEEIFTRQGNFLSAFRAKKTFIES